MQRALASLRHRGVPASARLIVVKTRRAFGHSAVSVWYELEVQGERPRRELGEGFELRGAQPEEVGLVDQLPVDPTVARIDAARALHRLDQGAKLWLVTRADQLAFACWTYAGEMPMRAARGGVLLLPPGVVCLEDSLSSPAFRGQGVAPAAWTAIADRLGDDGCRTMVTKVGEENTASRRAVEKAGFREVGRMRSGRRGWSKHLTVRLAPGSPQQWLRSMESD